MVGIHLTKIQGMYFSLNHYFLLICMRYLNFGVHIKDSFDNTPTGIKKYDMLKLFKIFCSFKTLQKYDSADIYNKYLF